MTKLYRLLKFKTKFFALLILVLVALYVLAGRALLGILPDKRLELEAFLTEQLSQTITIDSIATKWVGFDPVITARQITVNGPGNARVGRVSVRVAVFRSILAMSPRFRSIQLIDSHLFMRQFPDGSLSIAGIPLSSSDAEDATTDPALLGQIVDGAEINLYNNSIVFTHSSQHGDETKTQLWRFPEVSMNYRGDEVYANGYVLQPDGDKTAINFALNGQGVVSPEPINGTLFLEARTSKFMDEVLKLYEWQGLSLQELDASSRFWLNFKGERITRVQGDLQISQINWKIREKSLAPIRNIAGQFVWENGGDSQQITLSGFGFDWAGQTCEPTEALINIQPEAIRAYASRLGVSCVSDIAASTGWLPAKLQGRLEVSQPGGFLVNAMFEQKADEPFSFVAELDNLSLSSYFSTPEAKGLDGYIQAGPGGGSVLLQSERYEIGFPRVFLQPWKTSKAEANIGWTIHDEDNIDIFSEGIRLFFDDGSLVYGDFILRLNPDDKEDYLSLSVAVQDVPFERAINLVPYHSVGKGLYNWLDRSVLTGTFTNGIYLGYGSTEISDATNDFTSSLFLRTEDGVLTVTDNWPKLAQLDSELHLQNNEMIIEASRASMAGTSLLNLSASLPDDPDKLGLPLIAKAKVAATPADLDYWLSSSPISSQTNDVAEQLTIDGLVNVDIELTVPVREGDGESASNQEVGYDIHAHLDGNTIVHKPSDLLFENVAGTLTVNSESGISADNVSSELLGQPANLSISQQGEAVAVGKRWQYEGGKSLYYEAQTLRDVVMNLETRVVQEDLVQHYELDPIPGLSGSFDIAAELVLPANEELDPVVNIHTDGIGLARDWPSPYDKTTDEAESIDLSLAIGEADQLDLTLNWSKPGMQSVSGGFLFEGSAFQHGSINLGGIDELESKGQGLQIAGKLDSLALEPWIEFINGHSYFSSSQSGTPVLQQIDLDMDVLDIYGFELPEVIASLQVNEGSWGVDLSGPTVVGTVTLATEEAPLTLELDRLVLPDNEEDKADAEGSDAAQSANPSEFPEILFSTKELVYEGRNIGAWSARLEPYEHGAYLRDINGQLAGNQFSGQLNWQQLDDVATSFLTLALNGKDIDDIVQGFGGPEILNSKTLSADASLVWSGDPMGFELGKLSGKLDLTIKDGVLNTSDSKTGFLRVFGVLNAETITRRLKLDFSDLYKSGLSYDELVIDAAIDSGTLRLEEPLKIKGPSSKYEIEGKTNLAKKELDMEMRVELPITQNVPLAALMLGAPQIGGAVWLVDKLLGEPLSDITTARYKISGTWDKPKLDLKEAANAGRKSILH